MNMSPFNKRIPKRVLVVNGNSFRSLFTELFKVQMVATLDKDFFLFVVIDDLCSCN